MADYPEDELGTHVSAAGGVSMAPARARALGCTCLQLFTKQPSRWAEPALADEEIQAFRRQSAACGIRIAGAHDSYLINLSSPDPVLRRRSVESFCRELERCAALELDFLVTHPGNATDREPEAGIERNARGLASALERVEGPTRVLLEITAGSGTSVGGSFERLARILDALPPAQRDRVGVCFDTCHAYAAGYDLAGGYDQVWEDFERVLGMDLLGLIHMNDSKHPLGSRKDRHEAIGEGTLGPEPFRRIMLDANLSRVPKILETPKGEDGAQADLRNLARLRAYRG